MTVIRLETTIAASPERCFDLARDVDLHQRSTAATGERAVAGVTSGLLGPGQQVTWAARHLGMERRMTSRITEFERPRRFTDEMVDGPFRSVRHVHTFEPVGSGTRMIDVFEYRNPYGPLGKVADAVFLRRYMRRLLQRRNEYLKRAAEHGPCRDSGVRWHNGRLKEVEMADTKTAVANKPVWVDLSSDDAAASRDFYSKLFGWKVEVNPDPQYGGYGMAQIGDKAVAGIGPKMSPQAPTAWSLYIGTEDAKSLAGKVESAGGKVVAPPMQVGEQGVMAVFQDPSGAVISAWQPGAMSGTLPSGSPGTYAWAELNARGVDKAIPFYKAVFGWTAKPSDIGGGMVYNEFQLDGQSIAGGQEMMAQVPAQVPSHWMVYFGVDDVDGSFKKATQLGAQELVSPMDFPGGRFAIVRDPQGASFGLLKMSQG